MQNILENARIMFWGLALAGLFCLAPAGAALASDPRAPIPAEELSLETIQGLLDSAFLQTTPGRHNDIIVDDGGMRTVIKLDLERGLLSYYSVWRLKESRPEIEKLRFVNRLNDRIIIVRFSLTDAGTLWCDYQIDLDPGISPFAIVHTYKEFTRIVKGALARMDEDNLVGRESGEARPEPAVYRVL